MAKKKNTPETPQEKRARERRAADQRAAEARKAFAEAGRRQPASSGLSMVPGLSSAVKAAIKAEEEVVAKEAADLDTPDTPVDDSTT